MNNSVDSHNISDTLIEIHDPDIDPSDIMAQIRARIKQRREELGYDNRTFPEFEIATYPEEPDDVPVDKNLYHHLRIANETYTTVETTAILVPSTATRFPVLGPMWQLIRRQMHNLVLFYVNRTLTHQTGINRHVLSVLNHLVIQVQDQQRTIIALQAEVEALRQQRSE